MAKIDEINFDEKLPNGSPRYQMLKSGAVKDTETGKFVARRITSEEGREMVNGRWDKWRKANASAILKEAQAIDPNIKTEQEALAMAAGKTFLAILDSEKPRGDDLVKLSQLAGAYPTIADGRAQEELPENNPVDAALQGLISAMLAMGEKSEKANTVDGEIVTPKLKGK